MEAVVILKVLISNIPKKKKIEIKTKLFTI